MAGRKGEQEFIPGLAPKKVPKVHAAALRYADERDKRMAANKEEKEAQQFLLDKMQEAGLEIYEYGDVKVYLDSTRKAKVKVGNRADGEEGGEE